MKAYQIIGGQYYFCQYGEADTFDEAKAFANHITEWWDNFGGEHKPCIYFAEDCQEVESPQTWSGTTIAPKPGALPAATFNGKGWEVIA